MEKETYLEKLKEIEKQFELSKNNLYQEYALTNAKFKVGDIIKDHRWTIKIDRITTYVGFGLPEPAYHGIKLNKDLTPSKNGNRESIYGNNAELVSGA